MMIVQGHVATRIRNGAKAVLLAGALGLVLSTGQAAAQEDAGTLAQRLERLERDIQTLHKIVARGPEAVAPGAATATSPAPGAAPPPALPENAVARIGVRLDTLESELRSTTGAIEELTFKLRGLTQRLDQLVADVDFRLSGLEQHVLGQRQPSTLSAAGKPAAVQPIGQPPATGQGAIQQVPAGQPPAAAPPTAQSATGQSATAPQPGPQSGMVLGQGPKNLGTVPAKAVEDVEKTLKTRDAQPPAPSPTATTGGAKTVAPPAAPSPAAVPPAPKVMASAPPPATDAGAVQAAGSSALPPGTPKEQYRHAFNLLRKHQFDMAEAAFKEFIARHPDDALVGNARYWLGETHYARGEYVQAAEIFLKGFEADPKGPKAPDSLLKLAVSLGQLGQKTEACGAIAKMFAEYPSASSSLKRTATRQQRQLGCQ